MILYIRCLRFEFDKDFIMPYVVMDANETLERIVSLSLITFPNGHIHLEKGQYLKLLQVGPVIRADVGRSRQVLGGQRPPAHAITSRPNNAQH